MDKQRAAALTSVRSTLTYEYNEQSRILHPLYLTDGRRRLGIESIRQESFGTYNLQRVTRRALTQEFKYG